MVKKVLLFVFTVCVCLLIGELVFRWKGVIPGYAWQLPFSKEDDIVTSDDWQVDANGIFCMNPAVNEKVSGYKHSFHRLWADKNIDLATKYLIASHSGISVDNSEVSDLEGEELATLFCTNPPSAFRDMLSGKIEDSVDYYYRQFYKQPVNSSGFYSIPFRNFATKKKKVLLTGDSFTFGFSAVPSHNSFAGVLASKGYAVYNGGIPGTDPAQYCRIVETYIDSIVPDAVVVCFYAGNDGMNFDRNVVADSFVYFATNASWIKGHYNGSYFKDAESAYEYFSKRAEVVSNKNSLWYSLTMQSAFATQIALAFKKNHLANPMNEPLTYYQDSLSWSSKYITRIAEVCRKRNTPCYVIVIPDRDDIDMQNFKKGPIVFDKVHAYYLPATRNDYYSGADNHFNNEGHVKMANFTHKLLVQTLPE